MMQRRRGGNIYASLDHEHECKEAMCDEQFTVCLQHMDEQLADQVEWFEEQIHAQIGAIAM